VGAGNHRHAAPLLGLMGTIGGMMHAFS
jgi:MotA/TolQ/ExbB proton channel family.